MVKIILESKIECFKRQGKFSFNCKYSRFVETNDEFLVENFEDTLNEATSMGELTYSMTVTPGVNGDLTSIKIFDDHGIDQIYPRLVFIIISE